MKYSELEELLFKRCSLLIKNKGMELYNKNSIKDIYGKKLEEIYHIYGKVKINDSNNFVQVHIKIDLKSKRVKDYKCSCITYKEFIVKEHKFYCEHIAAVAYKFLDISKGKASKQAQIEAKNTIKENVSIVPRLAYNNSFSKSYFEVDFFIQTALKYPITDLEGFVEVFEKNAKYKFSDNFILNNSKYKLSENTEALYSFIKENINKDKRKANKIKILPENLEEFFKTLHCNHILFKDNYLEYKTKINKRPLPLAFNLNLKNESIVVTSEKNLPTLLDSSGKVVLFNREIYILDKEMGVLLKSYKNKLKRENLLYFPGNNLSFNSLIKEISTISKKINISKELIDYLSSFMKFTLYLYKMEEEICAEVCLKVGDNKINIVEVNKLKEFINMSLESRAVSLLQEFGFIKKNKAFIFKGNDEDLYTLLFVKESEINNIFNIVVDKNLMDIKLLDSEDFKFSIHDENWAIKLSYGFKDFDNKELKNIFNRFKKGDLIYRRKDGGFINLKEEKLKKVFNLISSMGLEKDLSNGMSYLNKSEAVMLESLLNKEDYSFIENIDNFNGIISKLNNIDIQKLRLKAPLPSILKNYQLEGVAWLNTLAINGFGGILADDMGLGKTIQILGFLSLHKDKKSLIITPTSLIFNWLSEIKKYTPWLKVAIIRGEKLKREQLLLDKENYNIFITTYGTVINDTTIYKELSFHFCVIDEAQSIKNHKAQITEAVKSINSKVKFALTGTPIENNLLEIWSIFDFIMPDYLFSKDTFKRKFQSSNKASLIELRTLISPFILRRTKSEVAKNLPKKVEEALVVQLNYEEMRLYDNYFKELRKAIATGETINILSYLTKLRQICLHPRLVDSTYKKDSSKLLIARNIIKDCLLRGEKILVFSQFTTLIELFEEVLQKEEIDYFKITGAVKAKDRLDLVNEFNFSKATNVFLISLKAGGTGLNLTSATVILHLDPWWNIAVENQASDRAHRIGQTKQVKVIKLIAKNTIEESIVLLQKDKKDLIDNVLANGDLDKITTNKDNFMDVLNSILVNNK